MLVFMKQQYQLQSLQAEEPELTCLSWSCAERLLGNRLPGDKECLGRGKGKGRSALCAAQRHLRAEAALGVSARQAEAGGCPADSR